MNANILTQNGHYSSQANGCFVQPKGNLLDNNILVPIAIWVMKMHVSTKIKDLFGDYITQHKTGKIMV